MHRMIIALALLVVSAAPQGAARADTPRVVSERYYGSSGSEAPHMIGCGLPGAPPYAGFGYGGISFAVEAGERSVDIVIDDDVHDLAVMAFVTQSPPYDGDPGRPGTYVCGSRNGIPLTSRAPVLVTLLQAVAAPPIRGSVNMAFHDH